jgi:hypothetical protein
MVLIVGPSDDPCDVGSAPVEAGEKVLPCGLLPEGTIAS